RTLTIKYKHHDFELHTKSHSTEELMTSRQDFWDCYQMLFPEIDWENKPIRLLGISVSNFTEPKPVPNQNIQLTIDY
ncbi:MAG: DNA polymerase IV, partial [Bacteroidota bacterium]